MLNKVDNRSQTYTLESRFSKNTCLIGCINRLNICFLLLQDIIPQISTKDNSHLSLLSLLFLLQHSPSTLHHHLIHTVQQQLPHPQHNIQLHQPQVAQMLSTHHLKVNTPQVEAQEIIHKEDTRSITTPNMGIILQNSTNKCGPIINSSTNRAQPLAINRHQVNSSQLLAVVVVVSREQVQHQTINKVTSNREPVTNHHCHQVLHTKEAVKVKHNQPLHLEVISKQAQLLAALHNKQAL